MTLDSEISKRFVVYLVIAGGMFASALFFWDFGSDSSFGRVNELMPVAKVFVLTSVTGFNLISFSVRMKGVKPTMARLVPWLYVFVLAVWFYSHFLFHYDFEMNRVIQLFFYSAAASTALNVGIYLYLKRSSIRYVRQ